MSLLLRLIKKPYLAVILVLIASIVFQHTTSQNSATLPITPTVTPTQTVIKSVKVTRVIDGDTIEIVNGQKVRYIGIDTPELYNPQKPVQCFAQAAYEKNKELIEGKLVTLEKDVSETDRYGRLLRYVFLQNPDATSEALFANQYLVSKGYAYVATFPPDVKYSDIFLSEQKNAMNMKKGLWSSCQEN